MKTTRRGLYGMLAGLFAGRGAAKAAPLVAAEPQVWLNYRPVRPLDTEEIARIRRAEEGWYLIWIENTQTGDYIEATVQDDLKRIRRLASNARSEDPR